MCASVCGCLDVVLSEAGYHAARGALMQCRFGIQGLVSAAVVVCTVCIAANTAWLQVLKTRSNHVDVNAGQYDRAFGVQLG